MKKSFLGPFEWLLIAGTFACPLLTAFFSPDSRSIFANWEWWLTFVASILNIFCCVCSARGNSWTFLFGAIYNALYSFYCIKTAHYGNAAVYGLFFLPMQLVGWLRWRKIGTLGDSDRVAAKLLSARQRILLLSAVLLGMAVLLLALKYVNGRDIVVDARCTALCVLGQTLLTLAYFEQWFIWIAVNLLTVVLWVLSFFNGGYNLSDLNLAICYFFVLLSSLNGLRVWLKLSKGVTD